jgi:hypothetical protein
MKRLNPSNNDMMAYQCSGMKIVPERQDISVCHFRCSGRVLGYGAIKLLYSCPMTFQPRFFYKASVNQSQIMATSNSAFDFLDCNCNGYFT